MLGRYGLSASRCFTILSINSFWFSMCVRIASISRSAFTFTSKSASALISECLPCRFCPIMINGIRKIWITFEIKSQKTLSQVCANLSRIMSAKSLRLASDDSITFRKSSQLIASNSRSVLARIEAFRRASVRSPISPK